MLSADISVDYPNRPGVLRRARIEVFPGEIVGLVGESGSGKSTLALAILGLLGDKGARVAGRTIVAGVDISHAGQRQLRHIRGRLASLIPQTASVALNPALRIGTQFREAWRAHSRRPWSDQTPAVGELLKSAGLSSPEDLLNRFPGEISVGQAQRILIVMALLHAPPLVIADEPTSALDVITQREVLDLLGRMVRNRNAGMLFISHDLPAVATLCDRVAILHGGEVVECSPVKELLTAPRHAYTQRLIESVSKWP